MMGNWHIGGYATITLFTVGIAFMVFACLVKLHVLPRMLQRGGETQNLKK